MMLELIFPAMLGMIGGLLRAFIGMFKALDDHSRFDFKHWLLTAVISGAIGLMTGPVLELRLAMLAGYAGMDLIESVLKISRLKLA